MLLIRPATRNDAAVLLAMIRELAAFERMPELVKNQEEDLVRDGFGEKPRFRALIAEWSGQVAGYAIFFDYYSTWAGPGIFLEDLFVREAFRGRGIGTALLTALEARATSWGIHRLVLKSSVGARSFYEHNGYTSSAQPAPGFGRSFCFPYEKIIAQQGHSVSR